MNNNLRIIKKQTNAEILARIMKAACRKYDCSMKIDFANGNRTVEFIGSEESKACIAVDVESILNGDTDNLAIDPNVAKAGGLHRQGGKGEAVVNYCEPLTTPDMESSGFPEG